MKLHLALLGSLLVVGCVGSPYGSTDRLGVSRSEYEAAASRAEAVESDSEKRSVELRGEAFEKLERDYIAPDCKSREVAGVVPRRCGATVVGKVWSKKALRTFYAKVCGLSFDEGAEAPPPECSARLTRKWAAALAERYAMMDHRAVYTRCDANPEECDAPTLERWSLESHNAAVLERFRAEQKEARAASRLEAREEKAQRERRRAEEEAERRARVQGFLDDMQVSVAKFQGKRVIRCAADGSRCWEE